MNPALAYALFCKGMDTYDIARRTLRTEAEVVEALVKYREMKDGNEIPMDRLDHARSGAAATDWYACID